jgi:hypothetical protein
MADLVEYARRELELLEEDDETIEGYLKVMEAFSDMGHSGGSASVAIPVIDKLLRYQNLTPLTDDPGEWNKISDEQSGEEGLWQSQRNPEAFSKTGGRTYYLVSEMAGGTGHTPIYETKRMHRSDE